MSEDVPMTLDRLAKVYLKIRSHLGELTKAYETEAEIVKAKQHEVALAMKDIMQATGQKSAKTDHGTIILSTKTRYVAQDWDAMKRFIIDNDAVDLLEKRIAQKNMSEFLEANPGVVPIGLTTLSEVDVSVRRVS
jgi:glycerol-3-phosphate responsive antiterminator